MLKLAGKSMAVALTLGMTSTVWAAAALPGSDPQVRALEQNRSQAEQQAEGPRILPRFLRPVPPHGLECNGEGDTQGGNVRPGKRER